MARHRGAVMGVEPDRLRLGGEVADGEDEARLADDDTVARPLGAQNVGGECVRRNFRPQGHHRMEHPVEVVVDLVRIGPVGFGEGPVGFRVVVAHRGSLIPAR